MSKQLVLCVGLNKTGTTSIQQTCFANRRVLKQAGFLYPQYSLEGEVATNHTALLQSMFWSERRRAFLPGGSAENLVLRDMARSKMAGMLARQKRNVLMVAEGVCEMGRDEMLDLHAWFRERDWSVRVICSVRHLSAWVHSMVAQRVAGLRRMTIPAVIEMFSEGLVRPRIENIRAAFPDAEFRSFEEATRHRLGLVAHFLDSIGVPLDEIDFRRARDGRSDCAIRVMSVLNELDGVKIRNEAVAAITGITGPKFRLRLDEAAPLLPMVDAEDRWLREAFGEAFHGPAMRFGPVDWTDVGRAQLASALKQLPAPARAWLLENRARWAVGADQLA